LDEHCGVDTAGFELRLYLVEFTSPVDRAIDIG